MSTRIFYHDQAIQIDGMDPVPARSMAASLNGDRVMVKSHSGFPTLNLLFGEYRRQDGTGFASAAEAKIYLDAEFGKIPGVAWAGVADKPTTYPPAPHTHPWGEVTGKPTTFPPANHTHLWAEITDKPTTFPPAAHTHAWADITGKPTTFPPAAHTHAGLLTYLGDLNVAETLLIALTVGMKRKTFPFAGVTVGDKLSLVANGSPTSGCEAVNVYPASANNVSIGYYTPALAIGAAYSIPVSIYRIA